MMKQSLRCVAACFLFMYSFTWLKAQEKAGATRCGSMDLLEYNFKRNPDLKLRFETQKVRLQEAIQARIAQAQTLRTESTITYVPVVFHIVMHNPALVTDVQLQAQLDELNKDY